MNDPQKMSDTERLDELSVLLTTGLMRLWLKRRQQAHHQERAISRSLDRDSLGLGAESRPTVTAGKP